jgi:hypothetical protein
MSHDESETDERRVGIRDCMSLNMARASDIRALHSINFGGNITWLDLLNAAFVANGQHRTYVS